MTILQIFYIFLFLSKPKQLIGNARFTLLYYPLYNIGLAEGRSFINKNGESGQNFRMIIVPADTVIERHLLWAYHSCGMAEKSQEAIAQRAGFLICNGVKKFKKISDECFKCTKMKAKGLKSILQGLPPHTGDFRNHMFSYISLDILILPKYRNTSQPTRLKKVLPKTKNGVGLFAHCLITKFVAFSTMEGLGAADYMVSLQAICDRYGSSPTHIYCDLGTQLQLANKEMSSAQFLTEVKSQEGLQGEPSLEEINEICSKEAWVYCKGDPDYFCGSGIGRI